MASSFRTVVVAALAATAWGLPATYRLTPRQLQYHELSVRQNQQAGNLSDVDILQFALTLEHLETAFYNQGFQKFPDETFTGLGLSSKQVSELKRIAEAEQVHVTTLQSSIAQAGFTPVQPCTYNFNLTDAPTMIKTAVVLENVGVSAYLGAAPLLSSKSVLAAAGSIVTIESRHQTTLRIASGLEAVPQAFDAALGPRAVFSLAKPFIQQCPDGSNLNIQPFPPIQLPPGQDPHAFKVGQTVPVQSDSAAGATQCCFTSGMTTACSPLAQGSGCQVPQGVAGVAYLSLARQAPPDGMLSDENTVAGFLPMVIS